jgi:hypothetical protein
MANRRKRAERAGLVVICVAAATVYLTLIHAPFLSWDDDRNISANPYLLNSDWWPLWLKPYFGLYVPVTTTVWAALFHATNGNAEAFRVFNAALHVVNTILVWQLLRRFLERMSINGRSPRTGIAVLLGVAVFAVHPLQTATVGWISGGRDVLATTFALGSTLLYFRRANRSYVMATLLFGAGLLSKPSIAAVPIAIVCYVALFEKPALRRTFADMAVWCALVAVIALRTSASQSDMMRVVVPLYQRPLVAVDAAGFYVLKTLWPVSLNLDYGRTPAWILANRSAAVPTTVALVVVAIVLWLLARRRRAYAVSLAWLILLTPVLGITTFAFQHISTVSDHYTYLPLVAVAMVVALAANDAVTRRGVLWALLIAMLVSGSVASVRRLRAWRSDQALFSDVVSKNPHSFIALTNLAKDACAKGSYRVGLDFALKSLQASPAETAGLVNKAYCLFQLREYDELIEMQGALLDPDVQFNLERNDDGASALANLIAGGLFQRGQPERGWAFLCQARALNPRDRDLQANAAEIADLFRQKRRQTPTCPRRLPWATFADLVVKPGV